MQGKAQRQPQSKKPAGKATALGEVVHTDLYGPVRTASRKGHRYAIVFVDDYSRERWVEFLKKKSECPKAFLKYLTRQAARNITVRRLHGDGAKEYMCSAEMEEICLETSSKLQVHHTHKHKMVLQKEAGDQ